jgi:hypothetical protein
MGPGGPVDPRQTPTPTSQPTPHPYAAQLQGKPELAAPSKFAFGATNLNVTSTLRAAPLTEPQKGVTTMTTKRCHRIALAGASLGGTVGDDDHVAFR